LTRNLHDRGGHPDHVTEAAKLLSKIVDRMNVEQCGQKRLLFSFEADDQLYSGLCEWGACNEDLEDDDPREEDHCG